MSEAAIDPSRFRIHDSNASGFRMAYVRENVGGVPLVLLHGWPESKRIFWKVIAPLADAGFEVIVPDMRGFGDSEVPVGGYLDTATHADDLYSLVHGELGRERVVLVSGDLGGAVIQELAMLHPHWVDRMVLFNSPLPWLPELMSDIPNTRASRDAADYFHWQGREADVLAAEHPTARARLRYISTFYTSRSWAHPGAFSADEVAFHTEPFADPAVFRASLGDYEARFDATKRHRSLLWAQNDHTRTLILHGTSDHVMYPAFDAMAAVVFPDHVGPFLLRDCGHFVPWEAPHQLVSGTVTFCLDRLVGGRSA